jgi:TatD DNase family protein
MPKFINIHTHQPSKEGISIFNMSLSEVWSNHQYASFGFHPWEIGKMNENEVLKKLKALCLEKKIIAVGEIGLDRAINTPLEIQKEIFIKQLELANEFSLPVIIHSVRSNSDLLQIKKRQKSEIPWIFHGFRGSQQEALQLVDKQCFLSFGKAVLHHKNTQEVLKNVALDFVFLETDDSDEKITTIYEKAAEILDICIDDLKEKLHSNFIKVFKEPWRNIG